MKRIAVFFISVLLVLSLFSGLAFADEMPEETPAIEVEADIPDSEPIVIGMETDVSDPDDVADNDELLMEYMEFSVSDSSEPMYSVFGLNHLTGINQRVYGLLKERASSVARGDESSTIFTFYMSDLGLDGKYTAEDLGVESVVSNNAASSEAKEALKGMLMSIDLGRVNTALLYDCPAEFYWYEKTVGSQIQYNYGFVPSYDDSLGEYVLSFSNTSYVKFSYTVAEDFAVNHASGTYEVDSDVVASIQTAIDYANGIIASYACENDYQKLVSYKEEICAAVSYNSAAGNQSYTYNYGNPWQLIWVFDNDETTNVVCEGYSKAFQFLCDGSEFNSDFIQSRLVTGQMAGGTGAGPHMWNVVTMDDGLNYLVDVTNCDSGTIGYPDALFLVGNENGSVATSYSIAIPGQSAMTYTYDDDTKTNYEESELVLAGEDYTEPQGTDIYPSMQNYAQVYPSAQNGIDISGAVYAVDAVTKSIDDETAVDRSGVPSQDLHFIQEWAVTSDTYPLTVSFNIAGSNNTTLYIFSGSDNGWTQMNKGGGPSLSVTFTEDTHAAVYVGPSLLTAFEVDDLEIVEGTCCFPQIEHVEDPDHPGEWIERSYNYYNPTQVRNSNVSITYDGVDYYGTFEEILQTYSNLTGSMTYFGFGTDQSYEKQWIAGGEYTATISFLGRETQVTVRIKKQPLESIHIDDITLTEGAAGANILKLEGSDYYIDYDLRSIASASVTYDGKEYSGTIYEVERTLNGLTGSPMTIQIETDQTEISPWTAGNTYQAIATLKDLTTTFNVTILESPFVDIEAPDVTVIENTDGYNFYAYKEDGTEDPYFRYSYNPVVTLTTQDGEKISSDDGSCLYQDERFLPRTIDDQDINHWELGTHQAKVYCGGLETTINVTVIESPIASLSTEPLRVYEGVTSSLNHFHPFTVTFKDGAIQKCERNILDYNGRKYDLTIEPSTSSTEWVAGQTYSAKAKAMGFSADIPVVVYGIDSIEIQEDNGLQLIIHQTNGETVTANVKYFEARGALSGYAYPRTEAQLVTDKGSFLATVVNYDSSQNVQIIIGEHESNVLSYSKWMETNRHAMSIWRMYGTFDGKLTQENAHSLIMDTLFFSGLSVPSIVPSSVYDADVVKEKLQEIFAFTEEPDLTICDLYNADDNTIVLPNWGIGGKLPEYQIIATDKEQGFLRQAGNGEEYDMLFLFDDDYKVTFMGDPDDKPQNSRIKSFTAQNVSIIEETCGIRKVQRDPQTGEVVSSYYEYGIGELLNLNMDITIDGERYTGTYYDIVQQVPDLVLEIPEQDAEHPWLVGETYDTEVTAILVDDDSTASCPIKITIIETPFSEFSFDDNEIVENTNGYNFPISGSDGETFYLYRYDVGTMSVKYDGQVYTGDLDTVSNAIWEASNKQFHIRYLMEFSSVQNADHRWTVGNEYPVTVKLGKLSDTFTIAIVPEAHEHTYGDWVVTKEATCTEAGSREKVCGVCGDKVTETIAAKGHTPGEVVIENKVEATCTEAGHYDEVTYCTVCEAELSRETKTIAAAHKWNTEYTVDKPATRTEEGFKSIHCSVCDEIKEGSQQVIPKVKLNPGWYEEDGIWYYVNNDGQFAKGWVKPGSVWYYMDEKTGAMATGLIKVGNAFYYMEDSGAMKANSWINVDGTWYYAQSSGALATGWLQSGSTWYYMDPTTCAMTTGWVKVGNSWYYMNPSGAMATGWVKDGDNWYYMSASGAMTTGWVKVGSSWYYMKADGAMAASEWCDGYWLNANGTWTYQPRGSWKKNDTGWWFGDTSGWYAKNETLKINEVLYTFDAAGYLVE